MTQDCESMKLRIGTIQFLSNQYHRQISENQDKMHDLNLEIKKCEKNNSKVPDHDPVPVLGGNRKKYIGKTKNFRSRTRRDVYRSRTNYRKKTVRRRR